MSEEKGFDAVLNKIEKLQESIRISEEVLPIVNELFYFVRDIIPIMVKVNAFMKLSSGKLPSAQENIENVTRATENATVQVLDTLDKLTEKLTALRNLIEQNGDKQAQLNLLDEISNAVSDMTFAFQFQDITTQQLNHVNQILEAIYERFINFFQSSLNLRKNSSLGGSMIEAIEYEIRKQMQEEQLKRFQEETKDKIRKTDITQDQIDSFFESLKGKV